MLKLNFQKSSIFLLNFQKSSIFTKIWKILNFGQIFNVYQNLKNLPFWLNFQKSSGKTAGLDHVLREYSVKNCLLPAAKKLVNICLTRGREKYGFQWLSRLSRWNFFPVFSLSCHMPETGNQQCKTLQNQLTERANEVLCWWLPLLVDGCWWKFEKKHDSWGLGIYDVKQNLSNYSASTTLSGYLNKREIEKHFFGGYIT